jgi:hypothetical protein
MHIFKECPLCEALKPKGEPKLTVRVGHRYKQRDGRAIDVTKDNVSAWSQSGYKTSVVIPHPCDLIEDLGPTPLEIKVGKRYEDETGDVAFVYRKGEGETFLAVWLQYDNVFKITKDGLAIDGCRLVKELTE